MVCVSGRGEITEKLLVQTLSCIRIVFLEQLPTDLITFHKPCLLKLLLYFILHNEYMPPIKGSIAS